VSIAGAWLAAHEAGGGSTGCAERMMRRKEKEVYLSEYRDDADAQQQLAVAG
jgi:hypothetical protein